MVCVVFPNSVVQGIIPTLGFLSGGTLLLCLFSSRSPLPPKLMCWISSVAPFFFF